MIYKELYNSDLNQCQRVCRSWYNIAHLQFLQSVDLKGAIQIEQFIRSIDSNKNSSYLNAVKIINTTNDSPLFLSDSDDDIDALPGPCHFDKAKIRKLLFRFPNLTHIHLWGPPSIYEPFDTKLCSELLKKCPKLDTVSVSPGDLDAMYKLRKLVTEITVYEGSNFEKVGGITKFLCNFPRLTSVDCPIKENATFKRLLPVFEKLPNVTHVSVSEALYDIPYFGEMYIFSRKQDKQDILTKRLSNVITLNVSYKEGFCENSMRFICKYFTGVKNFNMNCCRNYLWSDSQIQIFCNDILDLGILIWTEKIS